MPATNAAKIRLQVVKKETDVGKAVMNDGQTKQF